MLAAVDGMQIDVGHLLFGGPGIASTPSPQRHYQVNCDNPRPTIVLVPGISGSQLDGTQTGTNGCPMFSQPRQVWAEPTWLKALDCFAHMMSLQQQHWHKLWAYQAGFPDGTDYLIWRTYYNAFWKLLTTKYGYKLGYDLFAAPYDWRLANDGLDQIGEFDRMAERIGAAVKQNCGQKAIIVSHSLGVDVALGMLRRPRLQQWRSDNVQGLVQVGGSFAGAGASMWQTKLSGVLNPYPALTNILAPPQVLGRLPVLPLEAAVYKFSLGMPSAVMLMPTGMAEGPEHVLVRTPSRSYTVAQQKELLQAMGDEQSAQLIDDILAHEREVVAAGPIPGVETYCVYGTNVPTPMTLLYGADIAYRQPMQRPYEILTGPGDGSISLKSLRLCSLIAPKEHLVEISNPAVDHAGVFNQDAGLAVLMGVLEKFITKQQTTAAAATNSKPSAAAGSHQQPVELPCNLQQQQPAAAAGAAAQSGPAAAPAAAAASVAGRVGTSVNIIGKGAAATGKAGGITLRKGPLTFTFGR
ncbi:Lecithin:cholesterol acyltransferase-domain-containing protein [Scenedesmus sp. NREL 46B-D3]|nr:Lecithin:cholesterol acyltransferase-domain-containing protein [Scenedesmus sp. NREL 46B-D3]